MLTCAGNYGSRRRNFCNKWYWFYMGIVAIRERFFGQIGRNGEGSVQRYSTEPPFWGTIRRRALPDFVLSDGKESRSARNNFLPEYYYPNKKSTHGTYRLFLMLFLFASDNALFSCARLPDGRTVNTLRKAVFARLRRERRLTRNRISALLHLQSNKNRNFSLLSPVESLNLCANFKLVMIF